MYGLPKIHKPGNPLRPIVSSTGSVSYSLSKYLATLLDLYSSLSLSPMFLTRKTLLVKLGISISKEKSWSVLI